MKDQIQKLYDEAGRAVQQAKSILDSFDGKDMPQEKMNEVDALFEAHDQKVGMAQRYEKALEKGAALDEPVNGLPSPGGQSAQGGGSEPEAKMAAFRKALRQGDRALTANEAKALQADSDGLGGYLVAPQQMSSRLIKFLDDEVFFRQLATVERVTSADSLGIVSLDSDPDDADWTSELATGNEDNTMDFGTRELRPHPLAKRIKISRSLIRKSTRPIESMVQDRLAYKFAVTQEKAFMVGNGAQKPLGVFVASNDGIPTTRDVTAAGATSLTADNLIETQFNVKSGYMKSGVWLLHRDILKLIRKLKDANGQYLWAAGLNGSPATILERPFYLSEFAPNTAATGQYALIFGDFKIGYTIAEVDSLQIQTLLELYAATNQNGYIGRMEIDGQPVLAEAFSRLKFA